MAFFHASMVSHSVPFGRRRVKHSQHAHATPFRISVLSVYIIAIGVRLPRQRLR